MPVWRPGGVYLGGARHRDRLLDGALAGGDHRLRGGADLRDQRRGGLHLEDCGVVCRRLYARLAGLTGGWDALWSLADCRRLERDLRRGGPAHTR